jgi:hypothetical protein
LREAPALLPVDVLGDPPPLLELGLPERGAVDAAEPRPQDLPLARQLVLLVLNGESDRMVSSQNSVDLDRRLPNSQLVLYPDSGTAGVPVPRGLR